MKSDHSQNCEECEHIAQSLDRLQEHISASHSKHKCNWCEAKFDSDRNLKQHLNNNHTLQCPKCVKVLTTQERLDTHMKNNHTVRNAVCILCDLSFTSDLEINQHIQQEHYQLCNECGSSFTTTSSLAEHVSLHHIHACDICEVVMTNKHLLDIHYELKHTHTCYLCDSKFTAEEMLVNHEKEEHPNKCQFCEEVFQNKESVDEHILNNHTFDCDVCNFTGKGEEIMEDHILEFHATPNDDNFFKCDDCLYKSKSKVRFGDHYKTFHGSRSKVRNKKIGSIDKEYKQLKYNYERLERLYKESLDAADKAEHSAHVIKANDEYARVVSQNEALNEKLEVLYKLGRSYLDRNDQTVNNNESPFSPSIIGSTEKTIENRNEKAAGGTWTGEKLRGFKKSNTANSATSHPDVTDNESAVDNVETVIDNTDSVTQAECMERGRICHYFANTGQCRYEDRTGLKCKFIHKTRPSTQKIPMCQYGINCRKLRCTLSHPRVNRTWNNSGGGFLGNMNGMQDMNPWQGQFAAKPWIRGPFEQYQTLQMQPNQQLVRQ